MAELLTKEERILAGGIDQSRQELLLHDTSARILIVGAGATGSRVAAMLARMGFVGIQVWDDAVLEPENLGGGAFDSRLMHKPKVESVASLCEILTGQSDTIVPVFSRFDPTDDNFECPEVDIIIVGVDTLAMRQVLYEHMGKLDTDLYIDARMGNTGCSAYSIYPVRSVDMEWYAHFIEQIEDELMCGEKSTSYVVAHLESMVGNSVRAHANKEPMPRLQVSVVDQDIRLINIPDASVR